MSTPPISKTVRRTGYGTCKWCRATIKWVQDRSSNEWKPTKPGTDFVHSCYGKIISPSYNFYENRDRLTDV